MQKLSIRPNLPMLLDLKYRILIGVFAMTLLFVGFITSFISFISSQRKKLNYRDEMEKLRETQHNQLLEAAIRSEELERHRIAETLHDEVGAILSSAKIHLILMKSKIVDEGGIQLHAKVKELLDDVIDKVRQISHNLHSSILKEFGLNEAIEHFIKKLTENNTIHTSFNLDRNFDSINTEDDISIYRLIQELVNNILKHSSATGIEISSTLKPEYIKFVIVHDGIGITNQQFVQLKHNKRGMGLKNIQNRIALLRGKIDFCKNEKGYEIHFEVPLKSNV